MIDLHLHLDGSLNKSDLKVLAEQQGLVFDNTRRISVDINCKSLNEYLECFAYPVSLLQSKEALQTSVHRLIKRLSHDGLIYVEIRFAPLLHTQKGLSQDEIVESAIKGMNKALKEEGGKIKANLILCCMRNASEEENLETVQIAKKYLGRGVVLLDLAGAEAIFETKNFHGIFKKARELNIPFTIHAGEAQGADSVLEAVNMGAVRIGHGVRSVEDEKVFQMMCERKIPFEFCPISNLQTKALKDIKDLPLRRCLSEGGVCTINTDNLTVSGTSIHQEFTLLKKTFDLRKEEVHQLLSNSVRAAMVSSKEKEELQSKVDQNIDKFYQNI